VRCMLLRAEGHSYRQICEITGWTYTKVNRCLSEGRAAFLRHVAGIEAGSECERLQPLLSMLADGEARAEELAALRPHLKTCLTCRARLREYRATPTRVAALAPPALVAAGAADGPGGLRSLVESIVGATHDKAAALGERAHAAVELASAQKVAAVAASAAAIAGGGAGVDRLAEPRGEPAGEPAAQTEHASPKPAAPVVVEPPADPTTPVSEPAPAAASPEPPPPDPATEFGPAPAQPSPTAASAPAPSPTPAEGFAPAGGGGGNGGGGAGAEFGP